MASSTAAAETIPSTSRLTLDHMEALLYPFQGSFSSPSQDDQEPAVKVPTSYLRSFHRSLQAELNEAKEKTRLVKEQMEREDARLRVRVKEKEAVRKLRFGLEKEPLYAPVDLLPLETFQSEAPEDLRANIPEDGTDDDRERALVEARLRFEAQRTQSLEQTYADLEKQLASTRLEVDYLRKKSIMADQAIEEYLKMADKVSKALDDVKSPLAAASDSTV